MIETGLSYTTSTTVTTQNTAIAMGSGDLPVFATPSMVALMENAAMLAISDKLDEHETTVGGHIEASHLAPSSIGAVIEATATVTEIKGKKITFDIEVYQGNKLIGKASHVRVIVHRKTFLENLR